MLPCPRNWRFLGGRCTKYAGMEHPQPLGQLLGGDPLLLSPEEAAQVLRVGRTTLHALIKSGDLRPVHIGRSYRLSRAELERADRRRSGRHRRPARYRLRTSRSAASTRRISSKLR